MKENLFLLDNGVNPLLNPKKSKMHKINLTRRGSISSVVCSQNYSLMRKTNWILSKKPCSAWNNYDVTMKKEDWNRWYINQIENVINPLMFEHFSTSMETVWNIWKSTLSEFPFNFPFCKCTTNGDGHSKFKKGQYYAISKYPFGFKCNVTIAWISSCTLAMPSKSATDVVYSATRERSTKLLKCENAFGVWCCYCWLFVCAINAKSGLSEMA